MAPPTPLDAERARLRAKGLTDEEISRVFINRESFGGGSQQPTGAPPIQGNMTGVLGNASAALSHARGAIPAIKTDFANLSNRAAPSSSRAKSAGVLAGVAVIVAVLGYVIYQEYQIHIVYAPITAAEQAQKAISDAQAAADAVVNSDAAAQESRALHPAAESKPTEHHFKPKF